MTPAAQPWRRSSAETPTRGRAPRRLERLTVAVVIAAVLALVLWFLLFSGGVQLVPTGPL